MFKFLSVVVCLLLLGACAPTMDGEAPEALKPGVDASFAYAGDRVGHFGFGQDATSIQIAGWDIDVRPDGQGLPVGSGSVADGESLYEEQCAECHGSFGEGVGRYPLLAGGEGSLTDGRPTKTVGSYWPYTSTLYDYIYRAMPFTQPVSLSADETYALTAYVLYLNDLVDDDLVLDQDNLASIRLPNEANFGPDPRPDVANTRCMQNCRDPNLIKIVSEVVSEAPTTLPINERTAVQSQQHPGQATYDQYCSICHNVGVGGAPTLDDAANWGVRLSAGVDVLVSNAINGMSSASGVMPAKGGFVHLSDEQVKSSVLYMVENLAASQ